jgi:hypothetical protein
MNASMSGHMTNQLQLPQSTQMPGSGMQNMLGSGNMNTMMSSGMEGMGSQQFGFMDMSQDFGFNQSANGSQQMHGLSATSQHISAEAMVLPQPICTDLTAPICTDLSKPICTDLTKPVCTDLTLTQTTVQTPPANSVTVQPSEQPDHTQLHRPIVRDLTQQTQQHTPQSQTGTFEFTTNTGSSIQASFNPQTGQKNAWEHLQ